MKLLVSAIFVFLAYCATADQGVLSSEGWYTA